MKSFRSPRLLALGTMALITGLAPGRATAGLVVSFDSNSQVLSGTTPGGTGPWAEAIFTRLGDHEVQVQFTVPSNAVSGLYIDAIGFQFNTSSTPTFAPVSGVMASTSFSTSGVAIPATGNENFDTEFNFPNSGGSRVTFGQDSVYDITFSNSSPVLANDLSNLFNLPDASGHNDFAAAHLAGYGNGNSSGLTGHFPLQGTSVPEPSSIVLSSVGGILVIFLAWLRRLRALA
jgi:hypothetical protein